MTCQVNATLNNYEKVQPGWAVKPKNYIFSQDFAGLDPSATTENRSDLSVAMAVSAAAVGTQFGTQLNKFPAAVRTLVNWIISVWRFDLGRWMLDNSNRFYKWNSFTRSLVYFLGRVTITTILCLLPLVIRGTTYFGIVPVHSSTTWILSVLYLAVLGVFLSVMIGLSYYPRPAINSWLSCCYLVRDFMQILDVSTKGNIVHYLSDGGHLENLGV